MLLTLRRLCSVVEGSWPPNTEGVVFAGVWELSDGTFAVLPTSLDVSCTGRQCAAKGTHSTLELALERARRWVNEQAVTARREQLIHHDARLSPN